MTESGNKQSLEILAFAGSLREGSYNKALLRAAKELAPESMNIQVEFNQAIVLRVAKGKCTGRKTGESPNKT